MREIKFRFFDRKTNKVYEVRRLHAPRKTFELMLHEPTKNAPKGWTLRRFEDGCLMQYTGLKGMYEGDIIRDNLGVGVIKYVGKHAAFRVEYINSTKCKWFYDYLDSELGTIEIIGNIYENPELLEQL